jgi:flagellar biogenesis protein FliO
MLKENNMNVAIASGLADELTQRLRHDTQVYGPNEETEHTHGLVVGSFNDKSLYLVKVDDGKVVVSITHGDIAAMQHDGFSQRKNEPPQQSYEVNAPSFIDDLVEFIRDNTKNLCNLD